MTFFFTIQLGGRPPLVAILWSHTIMIILYETYFLNRMRLTSPPPHHRTEINDITAPQNRAHHKRALYTHFEIHYSELTMKIEWIPTRSTPITKKRIARTPFHSEKTTIYFLNTTCFQHFRSQLVPVPVHHGSRENYRKLRYIRRMIRADRAFRGGA